jgi:gliding motility-associated-like protein
MSKSSTKFLFICLISIIGFPIALFGQISLQDQNVSSKTEYNNLIFCATDSKISLGSEYLKSTPIFKTISNIYGEIMVTQAFSLPSMHNILLLEFINSKADSNVLNMLNAIHGVEYCEFVPNYQLFATPNDPKFSIQWNLDIINAKKAWDLETGNSSVKIAIIDDAVLLDHEDLQTKIWINPKEIPVNGIDDDKNGYIDDVNGWDAANIDNDPNPKNPSNSYFSHGTHVAGIAAGATNNSIGIASIGYACSIIPVKIGLDQNSNLTNAYKGVEYAIAIKADVINMSWGGSVYSQTYQKLFDITNSEGIVCVAAAGNSSSTIPMYPASYNHVISVASSTSLDMLSNFSNYGNTIDVIAPGSDILSTLAGGISSYGTYSGTSMASPLVAGLCGLMRSNYKNMPPDDLEVCLKSSCDNINALNPNYIGQIGAGRINALKAIQCLTKAPFANFGVDYTQSCPNKRLQFISTSGGQNPMTYQWNFPGGTPSTSTIANPIVYYANVGKYQVSLKVTNSIGTHSKTSPNFITIGNTAATLSGNATYLPGLASSLKVDFEGVSPYSFILNDGVSNTNYNNISENPFWFSVFPTLDTVRYSIVAFNDKSCNGSINGQATLIKFPDSFTLIKCSHDSLEVNTAQTGWEAKQKNGVWGATSNCDYVQTIFDAYNAQFPGLTRDDLICGPEVENGTKICYATSSQTTTTTRNITYAKLRKEVNLPPNAMIDSVRYIYLSDDFIDTISLNDSTIYAIKIVHYGQFPIKGKKYHLGFSNIKNYLYVKHGNAGGPFGSYLKIKIYYSILCPKIPAKCNGKRIIYNKCKNEIVQLNSDTGQGHIWFPNSHLDNAYIKNPMSSTQTNMNYIVKYSDSTCTFFDTVEIRIKPSKPLLALSDTNMCVIDTFNLTLNKNIKNPEWTPKINMNDNNKFVPYFSPKVNTQYSIKYQDSFYCNYADTINISVKPCCGITAAFNISDSILCSLNEVVDLVNLSKSRYPINYKWSFGPNTTPSTSIDNNPKGIKFGAVGTNYIKLLSYNTNCKDSITKKVFVINIKPDAGKDTTVCGYLKDFTLGTSHLPFYNFKWTPVTGLDQTNISLPKASSYSSITYYLSVQEKFTGCIGYDTINIIVKDSVQFKLQSDSILCQGDTVHFDLSSYNYSFTWQDSSKNNFYNAHSPGKIWVIAKNQVGCTAKDSATLILNQKPSINWPKDTFKCENYPLYLNAFFPKSKYYWNMGKQGNSVLRIDSVGWYTVRIENQCGILIDSIQIKEINCNCKFYVPNSFSPNENDLNDKFKPIINCKHEDYSFEIFNRWGQKIFKNDLIHPAWDGTYMNKPVQQGVYIWILKFNSYEGNDKRLKSDAGIVHLVR